MNVIDIDRREIQQIKQRCSDIHPTQASLYLRHHSKDVGDTFIKMTEGERDEVMDDSD